MTFDSNNKGLQRLQKASLKSIKKRSCPSYIKEKIKIHEILSRIDPYIY